MLRVELHDASNTAWLRVEGPFTGAFAEDTKTLVLRCAFRCKLVVDLTEATFVDGHGKEVLLWLAGVGTQFVAKSRHSFQLCERLHLPIMARPSVEHEGAFRG